MQLTGTTKVVIQIVALAFILYHPVEAAVWTKLTNSAKNPAKAGKCTPGAPIASGGCRWVRMNATQMTGANRCTTNCTWKYIQ